jgi:Tfp pilus assembly protein FimT
MVAIGIAVVVLGIAVPSFMSWLPTLRLSSGARQVATDLQVARMKAISQNTKFRMSFVGSIPGATSYEIRKDNGTGTFVLDSGPFSLPDGITVSAQSATPEFQPRGTASSASKITLQNTNSDTKSVQVSIVGRVLMP